MCSPHTCECAQNRGEELADTAMHTCHPRAGRVETGGSLRLAGHQSPCHTFSERSCRKEQGGGTSRAPGALLCLHKQGHTHSHLTCVWGREVMGIG